MKSEPRGCGISQAGPVRRYTKKWLESKDERTLEYSALEESALEESSLGESALQESALDKSTLQESTLGYRLLKKQPLFPLYTIGTSLKRSNISKSIIVAALPQEIYCISRGGQANFF